MRKKLNTKGIEENKKCASGQYYNRLENYNFKTTGEENFFETNMSKFNSENS